MQRISELEKLYVLEALENQFRTSKGSVFNKRLEKAFCNVTESEFSIPMVNGTATLHSSLLAIGIMEGDEVIVPALTMSSTAISVVQAGGIPVFADVDAETFTICPKSILNCITEKTKAIISVSLYGLAPDYDELLNICKLNNLKLIEDNAECFLGKYKGKQVGQFGHFSSYSFQASKHITCGNGGILTTNDIDLANKARRIGNLGYSTVGAKTMNITKEQVQNPNFERHVVLGYNYRLSEINAAVAFGQVERIQELVNARRNAGKQFFEAINQNDVLIPQKIPENYDHTFWCFSAYLNDPFADDDWKKFRQIFKKHGGDDFYAAWKLGYQEPFFKVEFQKNSSVWQKFEKGLCPKAERLQKRLIQFKTNYWDKNRAEKQAKILKQATIEFKDRR